MDTDEAPKLPLGQVCANVILVGSGNRQSAQAFKATYSILDETKTVRGLAAFILEQFLD